MLQNITRLDLRVFNQHLWDQKNYHRFCFKLIPVSLYRTCIGLVSASNNPSATSSLYIWEAKVSRKWGHWWLGLTWSEWSLCSTSAPPRCSVRRVALFSGYKRMVSWGQLESMVYVVWILINKKFGLWFTQDKFKEGEFLILPIASFSAQGRLSKLREEILIADV